MLRGSGGDSALIIACGWFRGQSSGDLNGGESCDGNNFASGRWQGFHLSS
jgi:hypothetical protein